MGRRLLYALVATCAMFAAACAVYLVSVLLPKAPSIGSLVNPLVESVSPATKQEKARLAELLKAGSTYRRDGDYERAIAAFREVADAKPQLADVKEAQFSLGQTYLLNRNFEAAASTFQQFYDRYAEDERHTQVAFVLGTTYRELKQWDKAISLLNEYAKASPAIDPYTRYQLGAAHRDAGNLPQAIEEFSKAVTGSGPRLFEIDAMEQIAEAHLKLKQYDSAALWYDRIRPRAATDGYKSELNYRLALAYKESGKTPEAKGLFLYNIVNYPATNYASLSLDEINKLDPKAVGYYQEGLVYYLNDRYDKALTSLGQLLANPQDKNAPDALYYQGLALQQQGNQAQAIAKFDQLMKNYPSSTRVGAAWFEKAESQWRAKSYADAIATYRQFATALPQHEQAPEARWEAAQLLEAQQRFEEARKEYATLQQTYPSGKYAEDALFRQGLLFFKERQYDKAAQAWEGYLKAYPTGTQKARGAFWTGKAYQAAGKAAEASRYLQQAIQAEPDEYYGFRARTVTQTLTSNYSLERVRLSLLAPESESERKDLVDWLGRWVSPPPTVAVFSAITTTITEDPGFKKAEELLKVGWRQEAADEFKEVANRLRSDALAQLQLSLLFRDRELYQLSIGAAQRVAALSGEKSYLNLPRFLLKLIYPSYYGNLVIAEAEKAGFDPLLLLSLIRQESAFNKDAISSAEARGLTQVIPPTADWIAQKLGMPAFNPNDLFKPYLSVRFGATYLGGVLTQFDGNAHFALAGYNGGPGNVARWSSNNPKYDVDLFAEDIDYSETRLYLKIVLDNYEMYKATYNALQ